MVLMGAAVAILNLKQAGNVSQVDTRINTMWGGIISLLPVVLGFFAGMMNLFMTCIQTNRIRRQRVGHGDP
jgi:hypothetical protein